MTGVINDLPPGYREPQHLGSGGWAEVFRCVDELDGRPVALKLFHQRLEDPVEGADAFRRECRTNATLSVHPGVVGVLAAGVTVSARPWLAMDLATGGTVNDLIRRDGPLSVERALNLTVALAETMSWAHTLPSPVIHGDLKPANILLDGLGRPLLSDFGVATHLGSRHSVTVAQFTQTHAAPEVLRDGRGSVSSDIWSLVATMFEMLTGRAPFVVQPGEGPGAFIERVQRGLPAGEIPNTVPEVVAEQIRTGLAVDRAERTPTMADLAQRLRAAQRSLGLAETPAWPPPSRHTETELRFVSYADAVALTTSRPLHLTDPPQAEPESRRRRGPLLVAAGVAAVVVLLTGAGIAYALTGKHTPAPDTASGPTATGDRSVAPTSSATTAVPTTPAAPAATTTKPASGRGSGGGSGAGSGPTTKTTPPGPPAVISSFTVLDHNGSTGLDHRLSFAVTPPTSALPISRYEFDYTGDGAADSTSASTTGFLTGLTNGSAYTVRVRACASPGCGSWSAGSPAQTPYGPVPTPGAGASKSGIQIVLSWNAGSTNGRPLSSVQISVDGGGWEGVAASGSRAVGNGPSQGHSIGVRAIDSAGQVSGTGSAGATTDGSSVGIGKGGSAQGKPGCSSSACKFITVTLTNFSPGIGVSCTFNSSLGSSGFVTYNLTTNGAGQASGQSPDYFGQSGGWVSATCNGVTGTGNW